MMLFGGFMFILFWVGVAALIYWAVTGFRSEPSGRRDPIDIARERYARGEITREQLQQITNDLHKAA